MSAASFSGNRKFLGLVLSSQCPYLMSDTINSPEGDGILGFMKVNRNFWMHNSSHSPSSVRREPCLVWPNPALPPLSQLPWGGAEVVRRTAEASKQVWYDGVGLPCLKIGGGGAHSIGCKFLSRF